MAEKINCTQKKDILWTKELKLAKELESTCKKLENGKFEEKDPIKSSDIIYQLGKLYMERCKDKLSLTQGIALLKAALIRNPSSKSMNIELKHACFDVLKLAEAKNSTDLLEVSKKVQYQVDRMRNHTSQVLKRLNIIPSDAEGNNLNRLEKDKVTQVRLLQIEVSMQYTDIMRFISDKCVDIMGEPPCQFSLVGMGSLARREITPFSDFEHIILLEEGIQRRRNYEKTLEYFRWFSVIFHIIVINLGETFLPAVAIPSLNDPNGGESNWFYDYNKKGISFDGFQLPACKFPLGRQVKSKKKDFTVELIKPVSEMLEYLTSEEDLKNGYHLADVLMQTCFVSGNKQIYKDFHAKVLEMNPIPHNINEDLLNFDVETNLRKSLNNDQINIKQVIYRAATIFVSALGKENHLGCSESLEIIEILKQKGMLKENLAHDLSYVVALACEVRLKTSSRLNGQDDIILRGSWHKMENNKMIELLVEMIGFKSLIDCFEILVNQQAKCRYNINTMQSIDHLRNICVGKKIDVLFCLNQFGDIISLYQSMTEQQKCSLDTNILSHIKEITAYAYKSSGQFEKALLIFKEEDNDRGAAACMLEKKESQNYALIILIC